MSTRKKNTTEATRQDAVANPGYVLGQARQGLRHQSNARRSRYSKTGIEED